MAMRFLVSLLFLTAAVFSYAQSHFDNVDWIYTKTDKNVKIYTVNAGDCNYYKAETTITAPNGVTAADLSNAINDYNKYMEIFKPVEQFKAVGQTEKGKIVRAMTNFSPMHYRVYHIEMWTSSENGTFITEWQPYKGEIDRTITKNQKYVTHVYGRWTFRDNPDGSVYICTEHHNNWEYSGLSLATVTPFEQNVAAKNVRLIYEYVLKSKKHK